MPAGQLLSTVVVKRYRQLIDGGISADAALAVMAHTEYTAMDKVGELRDEVRVLGAKVDGQTAWLDGLRMQWYAVIGLVVLGLMLTNVDILASTIWGAIVRKLVG